MNPLDAIDPFITQLTTLTGPKQIVVFLIMFGYMLKMIPNAVFANRFIPLFNCFVLGPAMSVLLLGWPEVGQIAPGVRYPLLAAWAQAYQTGALLAAIAWVAHGVVLKKLIDDKVTAWKNKPAADPVVPTQPQPTVPS